MKTILVFTREDILMALTNYFYDSFRGVEVESIRTILDSNGSFKEFQVEVG